MEFEKLVLNTLDENTLAGGTGSVFGPNVGQTATGTSGDNYASGDARNLFGAGKPRVLTRKGLIGGDKKKSRKARRKK